MIILLIVLAILWPATFLYLDRRRSEEVSALRIENATERSGLLAQIQANAQNMPYYPTLGPTDFDSGPVQAWISDDSGLVQFPVDDLLEEIADR